MTLKANARTTKSHGRICAICVCLLSLVVVPVYAQKLNRALPDDNLAYPVLITLKNSAGSGFYINTNTAVYLVTAKHVLFDNAGKSLEPTFELLSYSKNISDLTPDSFTVDTMALQRENIKQHPSQDVAVVKLFSKDPNSTNMVTALPGITIHTVARDGILGVGLENVGKFDDVLIGNDVMLLGYPTSLGLQNMPQIDLHRPLLRKGIVAGLNVQTHSIILDCPAYFGNSGGPVVEVDEIGFGKKTRIIGVMNQYVPYADGGKTFLIMANSGYSIATPMDYVLELIN